MALLDDLHRPPPFFPRAALQAATERQSEMTPALLELLAAVRVPATAPAETENFAWLYALFLLAKFREPRAFIPCRSNWRPYLRQS